MILRILRVLSIGLLALVADSDICLAQLTLPYSGSSGTSTTSFSVSNTSNGSGVQAESSGGNGLVAITSSSNSAVWARNLSSGAAVTADATSGANAVFGNGQHNGICGRTSSSSDSGVVGINDGSGYGVYGSSSSGIGTYGVTNNSNSTGVYGKNSGSYQAGSPIGVYGYVNPSGTANTTDSAGVYGRNDQIGYGVLGYTYYGSAVAGKCSNQTNAFCTGVTAQCAAKDCTALYASSAGGTGNPLAAYFNGKVVINGTIAVSDKHFKIDHPLDPANKYLVHANVESDEVKNLYNGIVETDAAGLAEVRLPDWFQVLNTDYRYQLTVIGSFSRAIIAQEISNNTFTIKTDAPNVRVSWQVTGNRQDPYILAHPLVVEPLKPASEKGKYLNPVEWGMDPKMGIMYREPSVTLPNIPDPVPMRDDRITMR